jgi:hypothetical protein
VVEKELRNENSYAGRISGFRECGLGPHIWPPRASISEVGKFREFI